MVNPFDATSDTDRHYIWDRLVRADSDAFVDGDWAAVEPDFDSANFEGLRAHGSTDPDDWRIAFADLNTYRDEWLKASREFAKKKFAACSNRQAVYARTRLNEIQIVGERAVAHKKFSGDLKLADGSMLTGSRQTLYRLHKKGGVWRIVGFIGYLPLTEI
jgi:hypothetical protein